MKQRISVEQLNELTDEQKAKLKEWWQPEEGDIALINEQPNVCAEAQKVIVVSAFGNIITVLCQLPDIRYAERISGMGTLAISKDQLTPVFSIGQCIAFLSDKKAFIHNLEPVVPPLAVWGTTEVGDITKLIAQGYVAIKWEPTNLGIIDALWEAVKAAL